jgi:SAM-dependent methyltransferase
MKTVPIFDAARLEAVRGMEATHFWFKGRRNLVMGLLNGCGGDPGTLLDAGCGTGYFVGHLRRLGYKAFGLDPLAMGTQAPLVCGQVETLPFHAAAFDAVLLCDVLEHVEDREALAEAWRVLRNRGWMVITVPAHPWLWSYRDDSAGHRRRYTRRDLEGKVAAAGFRAIRITYYQCLLFPLVVASRLLGGIAPRDTEDLPGPIVNRVMEWVTSLELILGRWVRLPWGSSLVMLASKDVLHEH